MGLMLGVVVWGLIYLSQEEDCSSSNSPQAADYHSLDKVDISLERLQFRETKGDKILWQMEASSAELYDKQRLAKAKDIKLVLYENQQPALEVRSQQGELDMDNQNINLQGDVWASSAQGFELKTDNLAWCQDKRRITTEAPVWLKRSGFVLEGRGLEADVTLEQIKVLDEVSTTITNQLGS